MGNSKKKLEERKFERKALKHNIPVETSERIMRVFRDPAEQEALIHIYGMMHGLKREVDTIRAWLDGSVRLKFDWRHFIVRDVFTGMTMKEYEEKYGPIEKLSPKKFKEFVKEHKAK